MVLLLALPACTQHPEVVVHTQGAAAVRIPVELALTPTERQRGLMFRRDLEPHAGMLFVFPESEDHSFWMKNTPLALDMIFINDDMRVAGIVADAVPFTIVSRSVGQPSRYVLEVRGGFSKQHGIQAGDRVEFHNVPSQAP